MKNKDNIKFIITLFLFLLPVFSEELKKYPSLAWASAGLGSLVALMTNARGVFLIKNLLNFVFPEVSINFETTLEGVQKLTNYLDKEVKVNGDQATSGSVYNSENKKIGSIIEKIITSSAYGKFKVEDVIPLDGKVRGVLFQNKNNRLIPADEFVVFRPQDNAFFSILPAYRAACYSHGADQAQLDAVDHLIAKIEFWRASHPDRCKTPDCEPGETPKYW